ncbi:hypothetical protein FACS1894216_10930 [Synergistales bacterium]|nr:hypothetical protein FACS1894216_10930 [Synergistales bacterium]
MATTNLSEQEIAELRANSDPFDPKDAEKLRALGLLEPLTDEATLREMAQDPNTEWRTDDTGMDYMRAGDYWIPALLPPKRETLPSGKYAQMRLTFLENHRKWLLASLRAEGTLVAHLTDIEETANRRLEMIMAEILRKSPPPDKAANQMSWVRHMNITKAQAEEMILELIYE